MRRAPPVPVPPGLAGCRAFLRYEGPARELVAQLKYRNARDALGWLAEGVASLVWPADGAVAVTWAPTTAARRRQRGFDQAELLARRVGRRLGLPCTGMLRRSPGLPQVGRPQRERWLGPQYSARARRSPVGTVLLVDDVVTTGATLAAAGAALRAVGVEAVIGLAAAHAPRTAAAPSAA